MSLQVWLPLNGTVENKGLSGVTISGNVIYDNNGKIGKCGRMGSQLLITSLPDIYTDQMSLSFWVKSTSTTPNWHIIVALDDSSMKQMHGIYIADSGRVKYEYNPSLNIYSTISEWHHYTYVLSNSGSYGYVDGKLQSTSAEAMTHDLIARIRVGAAKDSMFLNDVRIYDHCLSPKEVKEISKGLCLHYRLSEHGCENLLSEFVSCGGNSPTTYTSAGRTKYYGSYGVIIPADENADTYFSLFSTKKLEQGKTYTISCTVSGLKNGTRYDFPLFQQGNTSMGVLRLDHNGKCCMSFSMNYTGSISEYKDKYGNTVYRIFMDDSSRTIASGQGEITISNFKLEEGLHSTPWVPNEFDLNYSISGYNSNVEHDCSGFGNDGIKENIIADSDTPRHATSFHLNGVNLDTNTLTGASYIVGTCYIPSSTEITFSWWGKINKYSRGGIFQTTSESNPAECVDYATTAIANWDQTFGVFNGSTRINLFNQIAKIGIGWQHNTIVFNGTDLKCYVNGKLERTDQLSGALPSFTGIAIGIGKAGTLYRQIDQNVSDFRIYATALSNDDVLDLYQTGASIDDNGCVWAYEYKEEE